ncbi:MAG TPA: hypothetical protein DCQ64_05710 [Candidatus Rokubacteria bacterium]|nr:hypothetical protein [Candidatus Rokubacteria bacterium]
MLCVAAHSRAVVEAHLVHRANPLREDAHHLGWGAVARDDEVADDEVADLAPSAGREDGLVDGLGLA